MEVVKNCYEKDCANAHYFHIKDTDFFCILLKNLQ